jgi:hypothetical protein
MYLNCYSKSFSSKRSFDGGKHLILFTIGSTTNCLLAFTESLLKSNKFPTIFMMDYNKNSDSEPFDPSLLEALEDLDNGGGDDGGTGESPATKDGGAGGGSNNE